MRVGKPEDAASAHTDQASSQDAAQVAQSDQQSDTLSSETSSTAPSPPSTAGGWQGTAGGSRQPVEADATYFGLTSASVLEDAPGKSHVHASDTREAPSIMDVELSSKRLEEEAAEQREHSCGLPDVKSHE